jgi:hypothetical protein
MDIIKYLTNEEFYMGTFMLLTYIFSFFTTKQFSIQTYNIKKNTEITLKTHETVENISRMLDERYFLSDRIYDELSFYKDSYEKEVTNMETVINAITTICNMDTIRSARKVTEIKNFLQEIHKRQHCIDEEVDEEVDTECKDYKDEDYIE